VEIDIRRATPDDTDDVRRLVHEAYGPYVERIGRRPAPMDSALDQLIAASNVWVALRNGTVVGVLVVQQYADHLFIDNIAVGSAARGLGVGSRLLSHAEELARQARTPELRLYTNARMTENLAYYPRRGFTETHRAYSDGFDRVFYRKSLDNR
jgi:ribosomal protein S18 acetylase RimI-like enzyme